jgi:transcriptional regulator with XRE-family HTH domain
MNTIVGLKIRSRRQELGMTQKELADKLGYTNKSSIGKIESGINDITQSKVVAFAEALQTTPAYLMGWEDEETNIVPLHPDIKEAEEDSPAQELIDSCLKLSKEEQASLLVLIKSMLDKT